MEKIFKNSFAVSMFITVIGVPIVSIILVLNKIINGKNGKVLFGAIEVIKTSEFGFKFNIRYELLIILLLTLVFSFMISVIIGTLIKKKLKCKEQ